MSNFLKFTCDKLNVEDITNLVTSASCGAISVFVGTTRNNFDGKTVLSLEYEAYEAMGIKAMEKICIDIRKQWGDVENIALYHRLGRVPIKEASVVIAVSSPHREDAIKATEFCINSLKRSVPIWKKEIYSDNQSTWKENKESQNDSHPPKRKKYNFEITQEVQPNYVPPHLIQIKASKEDLDFRIGNFMERKRAEIDAHNIAEFLTSDQDPEFSCARIDAVVSRRKDSKSHLQVERVLNSYQNRDQKNSDYLKKFIPRNGIDERLHILESQLSLEKAVPKNIYQRIKNLENRLLFLESISPEYIQFWDRTSLSNKTVKKKVFSPAEIEELIGEVEKKCNKTT